MLTCAPSKKGATPASAANSVIMSGGGLDSPAGSVPRAWRGQSKPARFSRSLAPVPSLWGGEVEQHEHLLLHLHAAGANAGT